jgi:hypothetical protein
MTEKHPGPYNKEQLGLTRTGSFLWHGETATEADYFLAVRMDGERNNVLTFSSPYSAVSVCATQARGICSVNIL